MAYGASSLRSTVLGLAFVLAFGPGSLAQSGPLRLLKDVNPQGVGTSAPMWFTEASGKCYFTAFNLTSGRELWSSDGTELGTTLVTDLRPGFPSANPADLVVLHGALLFTSSDGLSGREWWTSDGTEEGTRILEDIRPGPAGAIEDQGSLTDTPTVVFQGHLYFRADDGTSGSELWRTDGTAEGTALFKEMVAGPGSGFPGAFAVMGDTLYFTARDDAHGQELWKSDGTASGTGLVRDIVPGPASSGAFALAVLGDRLLLAADDGEHGVELWQTDGTGEGTWLVRDLREGPDGGYPLNAVVLGNVALFHAEDAEHGREMWRTDGTEAGTVLLADAWPGPDSVSLLNPVSTGAAVFWATEDPEHGFELWTSDGSAGGTARVGIQPGPGGANVNSLTPLLGAVLFNTDDGVNGPQLWRVAGGSAAPVPVQATTTEDFNGVHPSAVVGSRIFLAAFDPVHGFEPWTGHAAIVAGDAPRAIEDLEGEVGALDLPAGTEASLLAKLQAAARQWGAGAIPSAIQLLEAFERQVHALAPETIAPATAEELVAFVREIVALGGSRAPRPCPAVTASGAGSFAAQPCRTEDAASPARSAWRGSGTRWEKFQF